MHRCNAKCEVFIVNGGDLSCMCVQKSIHWWSDQCEFWCSRVCISVTCSVLLQHEGLLKVSIGLLEASWDVFGDVLGRLGSVFRTSWGVLGASWKRVGGFLGRLWSVMEASEGVFSILRCSEAVLGPSWSRLRGAWQRFGGVLEAFWKRLTASWGSLGGVLEVLKLSLKRYHTDCWFLSEFGSSWRSIFIDFWSENGVKLDECFDVNTS